MPNNNNAVIAVHYCAEPAPRPPREIVFNIDQNDIQVRSYFLRFAILIKLWNFPIADWTTMGEFPF